MKASSLHTIQQLGQQLIALSAYQLELLRPDIEALLSNDSATDEEKIQHMLDKLYDCILWGTGEDEYQKLLSKLEKLNPESVAFYRKELDEM